MEGEGARGEGGGEGWRGRRQVLGNSLKGFVRVKGTVTCGEGAHVRPSLQQPAAGCRVLLRRRFVKAAHKQHASPQQRSRMRAAGASPALPVRTTDVASALL